MIKLQNNYTTPEQSKRLLALGVPANSADCYYIDSMTSFQDKSPHIISPDYKYSDGIPNGYESRFCPCWSVGCLMDIYEIVGENAGQCISCSRNLSRTERFVQLFEENASLLDFSKLED